CVLWGVRKLCVAWPQCCCLRLPATLDSSAAAGRSVKGFSRDMGSGFSAPSPSLSVVGFACLSYGLTVRRESHPRRWHSLVSSLLTPLAHTWYLRYLNRLIVRPPCCQDMPGDVFY
ncbi:unnamed protein product, partial [Pylaiella littoralis]